MNKDDIVVATLPIEPQEKTNLGMYIAPTLMNVIGEKLNCHKVFSINTLNTYIDKNDAKDIYLSDIQRNGIKYDTLLIDSLYTDKLLEIISNILETRIIKPSIKEVTRCACGKVDILSESIKNEHLGKLYKKVENNLICKSCGSICKSYKESVLILKLKNDVDDTIKIVPSFLKNDTNNLTKVFKGSEFLISKQRNTGYTLTYNKNTYNIDIDFIWANYFKLFSEDNQVLIASNHQLYQMYIMNYLSRISSNKNISFVATPYIKGTNGYSPQDKYEKSTNDIYKKLLILYSLKWKKKDCNWDKSIVDYISNISDTRKLNLYKTILNYENNKSNNINELDVYLEEFLKKGINMQKNIVDSKKLVRKKG